MSDFLQVNKKPEEIFVAPQYEDEFQKEKEKQLEEQRQRFEEAKRAKKVRKKEAIGEEKAEEKKEEKLDEQQKEIILVEANERVEEHMPPKYVKKPDGKFDVLPGYKAPNLTLEAVSKLNGVNDEAADMKLFMAWQDKKYILRRPGAENLIEKIYKNKSDVKNIDGTVNLAGLKINRLVTNLESRTGSGYSNDELVKLLNNLMPEVRMKHEKISKEQADQDFDASMIQLKGMYYKSLKYLESTYGKKLSQLHMEDVLRIVDIKSLRTDFAILQDTEQFLKGAGKYMDPNDPEDAEFIRLSYYYNSVYVGTLNSYFSGTRVPGSELDDRTKQTIAGAAHYGLPGFKNLTENDVEGPSLTEKEKKEYGIALRNRAKKEGWEDRLYGRFLDEEETEKKIDIPEAVTKLIDEVLGWTKVKAETSIPVQNAAQAVKNAKSREQQSEAMTTLREACQNYMAINGNKTYKSSRRKTVVTQLLSYSPIYFANENAINLRMNTFEVKDDRADFRMRTGMDVKSKVGFSNFNTLSQFYDAFAGDGMPEEEFRALIKKYGNGAAAPGRSEVMETLTQKLLAIDISGFDYSSDKSIVDNAARFESMSAMVEAYRDLLSDNPEYADALKQRQGEGAQPSDFAKLADHLEKLSAISDYYRIRKLIISDSEYIAGGVKDRSIQASDSKGTLHLKELLRASDHITKNLDRLFGKNKAIEIKSEEIEDPFSKSKYSVIDKAFELDKRKLRTDRDFSYGMEREDKIREQIDRLEREAASIIDVRFRDCLGDINKDMPQKSGMFARLYSMRQTSQDGMFRNALREKGRYTQRERVSRLVKKLKYASSTGADSFPDAKKYPALAKFKIHDVPTRFMEKYCSELYDDMSDNEIMELITNELITNSPEYERKREEQLAKDADTYGSGDLEGMSEEEAAYYEEAFADAAMRSLFRHNAMFERLEQALGAKALFMHPADVVNRLPDELMPLISAYTTITNIIIKESRKPVADFINQYQKTHAKEGKSYEGKYKLDASKFVFGAEAYSSLLFAYTFYSSNFFIYQAVAYDKATAKHNGEEIEIDDEDQEVYEKVKRWDIKKVNRSEVDRCYEKYKDDPYIQKIYKESTLESGEHTKGFKKVFIYYMIHPEAMSLDEMKKMRPGSYKLKGDYGMDARGVRLLTENGYGSLPSSKELKAYEKRLKDEGYQACHLDNDEKVITKDPYDLKDVIAIAEEKEGKKKTSAKKKKTYKKADLKEQLFIDAETKKPLFERLVEGAKASAASKGKDGIDPDYEPLKLYLQNDTDEINGKLNRIKQLNDEDQNSGLIIYCVEKNNLLFDLEDYREGKKKFTKGMKPKVMDRFDAELDDVRLSVEEPTLYAPDRKYELTGIAHVGGSLLENGTFAASLLMQLKSRGVELKEEQLYKYNPPFSILNSEKAMEDGFGMNKERSLSPYSFLVKKIWPDMKVEKLSAEDYAGDKEKLRKAIIDCIVRQKSPVSARLGEHYVTIYGIDGNVLKFDDHTVKGNSESTMDMDAFFAEGPELYWLTKKESAVEELSEEKKAAAEKQKLMQKVKTIQHNAKEITEASKFMLKSKLKESGLGAKDNPIPKEEFDRIYGEDAEVKGIISGIQKAKEALSAPVSYPAGKVPADEEQAKEKIREALFAEQEIFAKQREKNRNDARLGTDYKEYQKHKSNRFLPGQQMQALHAVMALRWKDGNGELKTANGASFIYNPLNVYDGTMYGYTRYLIDKPASDFAYESDAAFVSQFAEKYEELSGLAAAGDLLDVFFKLHNGVWPQELVSYSECRGRAKFYARLKEHYEERMKLITSPYYAKVSEETLKGYFGHPEIIEEIKDAGFKEFVTSYVKLQESEFGPLKKTVAQTAQKMVSDEQETQRDKDISVFREKTAGIDFTKEPTEIMDTIYRDTKEKKLEEYSKNNNMEFLKTVEYYGMGTLFNRMDDKEELSAYRDMVIDIYENGKLLGQTIKDEDQKILKPMIDAFINQRRDTMAAVQGFNAVDALTKAYGADRANPRLKDTEEHRRMLLFGTKAVELKRMRLEDDTSDIVNRYAIMMQELFMKLHEMDYTISEKYEGVIRSNEEKGLESQRKDYEKDQYELHPELKEQGVRLELPTYQVNGHTYTFHTGGGVPYLLKNKNLTIPGEDGARVTELLTKHTKLMHDRALTVGNAKLISGEGLFIAEVYQRSIALKAKPIMDELFEIVSKYDADVAKEKVKRDRKKQG